MHASDLYTLIALLAATASAQSATTSTATVLIPDWCVTQTQPAVTVLGQQDGLTTFSYGCPSPSITNTAAIVSSVSARASSLLQSARSRASQVRASLESARPTGNNRRSLNAFDFEKRQDDTCYGWNADPYNACIPWEIIQGPSTWAVHLTVTSSVALDQECTFGSGGVASGPATCTASGRLDPGLWGGAGDASRTRTFASSDVDRYFIRNAVPVTAGGPTTTSTVSGSATRTAASGGRQTTGAAAPRSIPTGAVVMAVGAGGIFAAALGL